MSLSLMPLADRFDALGLQQEMIVDKIDRAVAVRLQMLELLDHVLGRCASAICLR